MKVYCFYLYGKDINSKKYPAISDDKIIYANGLEYTLYSFTNEKRYANIFRKSRKKEIFIEKIIDMDKEQYEIFKENNLQFVISQYLYQTKKVVNGVITTDVTFIVSTQLEYDIMCFDAQYYLSRLFDKVCEGLAGIEPAAFNDTISNILMNTFMFYDIIDWLNMIDNIPESMRANTFALYFYVFSNTYNIERIDEACISTDTLLKTHHQKTPMLNII